MTLSWQEGDRVFERLTEVSETLGPEDLAPFLRIDPAQLPRLDQIEASAVSRLAEARERQWLGEVSALEDCLRHIRSRKAQAVAGPDQ